MSSLKEVDRFSWIGVDLQPCYDVFMVVCRFKILPIISLTRENNQS